MQLVKANDSHSELLIPYFQSIPIPGPIDLSILRHKNFFDQYRLESNDFETLMLMDEGQVQGVATFVYQDVWINHQKQTIAFATDLRISPRRQAVLAWSQLFLPILKELISKRKCSYIFSILSTFERRTYNNFVRPRIASNSRPRYYLLSRFQVIGVHGKYPFFNKKLPYVKISPAESNDLPPLIEYLIKKSVGRPFSYIYNESFFENRFSKWPSFSLKNIIIARDYNNNIIGCVAPWSSNQTQHYIPVNYHGFAQTLKSTFAFGSYLGISKKLAQPGTPLNFKYLTLLRANNPDIFHSLLCYVFENIGKSFLVYSYFYDSFTTLPPKGFITTEMPYALYTLLPPDEEIPPFLQPSPLLPPPDIEVCLL